MKKLQDIERLKRLLDEGAITESEYQQLKAEALRVDSGEIREADTTPPQESFVVRMDENVDSGIDEPIDPFEQPTLNLVSFKTIQGKKIEAPWVNKNMDTLTKEELDFVQEFLQKKLKAHEFSRLTLDERKFVQRFMPEIDTAVASIQVEESKQNYVIKKAEAKTSNSRMIKGVLFIVAFIFGIVALSTDWGSEGSDFTNSESGEYTTNDCIRFLNSIDIESISSDYKTYYSDGVLGMPEGKLSIEVTGNKIKYNRDSPVTYSIMKYSGGDGQSQHPYFKLTFRPRSSRGDEIFLIVYLNESGRPSMLSLESKIFNTYEVFEGGGNPSNRVISSGPSLKGKKR